MSQNQNQPDATAGQPLFQSTDDQERAYAPQQVPGQARPATEEADVAADTGRAQVVGDQDTHVRTPLMPVRPSTDANYPAIVPAAPDDNRPDDA